MDVIGLGSGFEGGARVAGGVVFGARAAKPLAGLPAADAERSVSGVEQRDICGSKWRLRRPVDWQCGGRSRWWCFRFQSTSSLKAQNDQHHFFDSTKRTVKTRNLKKFIPTKRRFTVTLSGYFGVILRSTYRATQTPHAKLLL